MKKLTIEQIMGLQSKQKFYVATEDNCKCYNFVALNPMTGKPLIVAITNSNYEVCVILDPASKKCEYYLEYNQALEAFVRLAEAKISSWKKIIEEDKLTKKSQ